MLLKIVKSFLFVCLLLPFLPLSGLSAETFDKQDFRIFVQKEMKRWQVPGAAVLLIQDGKVIFSEGFGFRNVEKHLPVDSETVFPIASCTKTFAPFTVGMLVDEKKVAWDAPIREYLPELKMFDTYTTEHITLRDALCHRSGLPRHDWVWMYAGLSRAELMARLPFLEPDHGFREFFQYNNIVYSISGVVVEKVSGTRWEDFVKERIFTPLGMNHSSLFIEDIQKSENHALPYSVKNDRPGATSGSALRASVRPLCFHPVNTTAAASCINSTIDDMGKWILFQLHGGQAGDIQILSPETFRQIHTPQMVIPTEGEFAPFVCDETPTLSYSLGWVVQPFLGRMMLNHSGGIDGFSAIVAFMPEEKAGVVVLTNLHRNMLPYIVAFNYFDRLFNTRQVDRGQRLMAELKALLEKLQGSATTASVATARPPSLPLKDYAGAYKNPAYGKMTIIAQADALFASFRDVKSPLQHLDIDRFQAVFPFPSGDLFLQIAFERNKKGQISALAAPLQPGVENIRFEKFER